jgi:hypothetical protein
VSFNEALCKSSQQSLSINQSQTLTGVPIQYGTCNGEVFDIGDSVVVQFLSDAWASPRVIGFESNPRECPPAPPIISWNDTVGRRYQGNVVVNVYSATILASGSYPSTPGPAGLVTAIDPSDGSTVRFAFALHGQQATALLFNADETALLDINETLAYDNVFWTASIPSYWLMTTEIPFNMSAHNFELSGGNIIYRPTGNVVFTGATIVGMPYSQLSGGTIAVAVTSALPVLDAADFQFSMAYANGAISGNHQYRYKSVYTAVGKTYVVYEAVPD